MKDLGVVSQGLDQAVEMVAL